MPKSFLPLATAGLFVCLINPSFADMLNIKSVASTSGKMTQFKRPQRGMSMIQVRDNFGKPIEEKAPIGKNKKRRMHHAITRWVYSDFTVVFAEKHVIDTITLKIKN